MMEDLVNQAERLTAEITASSAFPRVERNLKQLAETGQELWNRTSAQSNLSRQTAQVSASILLGGRGYDLTKVTQQLDSLSSRKQLLPDRQAAETGISSSISDAKSADAPVTETIRDGAVQSFLRNERESAILSAVESVKKKTFEDVDKFFWQSVHQEWEAEKMRILQTNLSPDNRADDSFHSILHSTTSHLTHPDQTMLSLTSTPGPSSLQQQQQQPQQSSSALIPEPRKIIDTVMQLIREGKPYEQIVGCIQTDGCRHSGSLDKLRPAVDVEHVLEEIASLAEEEAFLEDAVRLYDLADDHDHALQILNRLLAVVLASDPASNKNREQVEQLSLSVAERYAVHGHNASKQVASSFFLLLDLMTFFTYYHRQSLHDALDTITKLAVVPFSPVELDARVQDFKKMSIEIQRNIPDILIACMNILYAHYRETKVSTLPSVQKFGISPDFGNREQRMTDIREKARTLITFAGMIPYRMPGETNAKLVQLEVLMN